MANRGLVMLCVVLVVGVCHALPIEEVFFVLAGDADDTAVVESTIREVRAAPSQAMEDLLQAAAGYSHTYKDDDKGDVGYLRKSADKGEDGYQKFDSFHKKNGDAYGYEKHEVLGQEAKGGHENGKDSGTKSEAYSASYDSGADADAGKGKGKDGAGYEVNEHSGDSGANAKYTAAEAGDYEGDAGEGYGHYAATSGGDHHDDGGSHESAGHYEDDGGADGEHHTSGSYSEGDDHSEGADADDDDY